MLLKQLNWIYLSIQFLKRINQLAQFKEISTSRPTKCIVLLLAEQKDIETNKKKHRTKIYNLNKCAFNSAVAFTWYTDYSCQLSRLFIRPFQWNFNKFRSVIHLLWLQFYMQTQQFWRIMYNVHYYQITWPFLLNFFPSESWENARFLFRKYQELWLLVTSFFNLLFFSCTMQSPHLQQIFHQSLHLKLPLYYLGWIWNVHGIEKERQISRFPPLNNKNNYSLSNDPYMIDISSKTHRWSYVSIFH